MLPEPADTVQSWTGLPACVATVTVWVEPLAIPA